MRRIFLVFFFFSIFLFSPSFLREKVTVFAALRVTTSPVTNPVTKDVEIFTGNSIQIEYQDAVNFGCYTIRVDPRIPPLPGSNTQARCYTKDNPPTWANLLPRSGTITVGPFPSTGRYRLTFSGFNSISNDSVTLSIFAHQRPTSVPTATPTLPPAPTPQPDCTIEQQQSHCGRECGGTPYPENHTIIPYIESCADGSSRFICQDLGPQLGICGNLYPTPIPVKCKICPDGYRFFNDMCCKEGERDLCKTHVIPIRTDTCEPGVPCGEGVGCGLGTRGPCGKKIVDGKVTDDYTCQTAIGPIDTNPADFVKKLFGFLLGISGGVALLLILFSSYRIMASRGDPEKLQGAKETLTSAIVGLLFIIFSLVILEVVGVDILKIPGLEK